jgi:hypothetical protein
MTYDVEHAIYDMARDARGCWQALCECGWSGPRRRWEDKANDDGVDHLAAPIISRIAKQHDPVRHPASFARAVSSHQELSALLSLRNSNTAA